MDSQAAVTWPNRKEGGGFIDDQGVIYTNYILRGMSVNVAYIVDALQRF